MKRIIAIIALIAVAFFASESFASKSRVGTAGTKQTVKAKSAKKAPRKYKVRKYVTPPIDELRVDEIPTALPIPAEVATSLAKNDIDSAIRILRIEPPSLRTLNLLREAQRIQTFKKDKKVPKVEPHKFHQNMGIAYHNLYLYLKRNGLDNQSYAKSAIKFYRKASKSLSLAEQTESKVLEATILALSGKKEDAAKMFDKLDIATIEEKDTGLAYLAGYYAAIGDENNAIAKLNSAHELGGEHIRLWLTISDDFFMLENSDAFHAMIDDWAKNEKIAKIEKAKKERSDEQTAKKRKVIKKKKPKRTAKP